jgi:hypothetical protein
MYGAVAIPPNSSKRFTNDDGTYEGSYTTCSLDDSPSPIHCHGHSIHVLVLLVAAGTVDEDLGRVFSTQYLNT